MKLNEHQFKSMGVGLVELNPSWPAAKAGCYLFLLNIRIPIMASSNKGGNGERSECTLGRKYYGCYRY
jgi:hypothetical protein